MPQYVIRGGREGYDRLQILARALGPATADLFDRIGLTDGMRCLDLGCGGGEVSFAIARRVAPTGHVVGVDMDAVKLGLAREAAASRGIANVEFRAGNVMEWSEASAYDLVYARTLLQHLARPVDLLRTMWAAVRPGGALVVEDADFSSSFCEPPSPAFDFYLDRYSEVLRRRGGDPEVGRKLYRYFAEVGAEAPQLSIAEHVHADGDVKGLTLSTLEATGAAIVAEGFATDEQLAEALQGLAAATADPATIIALPRTFQAWQRRAVETGS